MVTIKPRRVRLEGVVDTPLEATVTIKTEPKYPMQILSATPRSEGYIECELTRNEADDLYTIKVRNLRAKPGRYVDRIAVKTDSTVKPGFQIYVYGNIKKPAGAQSN